MSKGADFPLSELEAWTGPWLNKTSASIATLSSSDMPWYGSVDEGSGLFEVLMSLDSAARHRFLVAFVVGLELGVQYLGWW